MVFCRIVVTSRPDDWDIAQCGEAIDRIGNGVGDMHVGAEVSSSRPDTGDVPELMCHV